MACCQTTAIDAFPVGAATSVKYRCGQESEIRRPKNLMENCILRPSMKTVWAAYVCAVIIFIAADWAIYNYAPSAPHWVLALPLVALIPPVKMHLSRRLLTLRFHDDHLTYRIRLPVSRPPHHRYRR